jgi:hypothetical protein
MDLYSGTAIGSGIGDIGASIANYYGNKRAIDKAQGYYDQIPGKMKSYYDDYINRGKESGVGLHDTYSDLVNNPSGRLDEIGKGYKESPGFQFALKQALQAASNASAAGGMSGSPMDQTVQMETATGLASKDFQDYMRNALNLFGVGIGGQEGEVNRGFDATGKVAQSEEDLLNKTAELQATKEKNKSTVWGDVFKGAASALPFLFL